MTNPPSTKKFSASPAAIRLAIERKHSKEGGVPPAAPGSRVPVTGRVEGPHKRPENPPAGVHTPAHSDVSAAPPGARKAAGEDVPVVFRHAVSSCQHDLPVESPSWGHEHGGSGDLMKWWEEDDRLSGGGRGAGTASLPWKHRIPPCYMSHPPLSVLGGTLMGGNCGSVDHLAPCDLYVSLERGGTVPPFTGKDRVPFSLSFLIPNMGVPKDPALFLDLVDFIVETLRAGKRVHVGCIGGHGRTGLVLAGVISRSGVETADPVGWLRQHYCGKAVESRSQSLFLTKHLGAAPAPVTKDKGFLEK